jgi:hypothetical protein
MLPTRKTPGFHFTYNYLQIDDDEVQFFKLCYRASRLDFMDYTCHELQWLPQSVSQEELYLQPSVQQRHLSR